MAVSNVIRFGKDGVAGAFDDNWLAVYGGEVITAFDEYNMIMPLVNTKVIPSGNTAEWPATWKLTTEYHEVGTELLGMDAETKKYTITLDDRPLVSHFEVDDIDVAMSHYDTRSEWAKQAGAALARQVDKHILRSIVLASREAASGSFPGGGSDQDGAAYENANLLTASNVGGLAWLQAIEAAVVDWDTNNVPEDGRYCIVNPAMWYAIRTVGVPTSVDDLDAGHQPVFGHADIDSQMQVRVATPKPTALEWLGVKILRSNNLPNGNDYTGDGTNVAGNFTDTAGVIFQKDAIAHLQLMGVMTETLRDVRRGTDFFVTKILKGDGALRPVCSIECDTT